MARPSKPRSRCLGRHRASVSLSLRAEWSQRAKAAGEYLGRLWQRSRSVKQKGWYSLPRIPNSQVCPTKGSVSVRDCFQVPVCRLMASGSIDLKQVSGTLSGVSLEKAIRGYQVGLASRTETGGCILNSESRESRWNSQTR